MRFVNLIRKDDETYMDAVVNIGCGPNFVKNRWKLFRQMIKEQGVKFWFRFWLTFCLEPDIKEQEEFSRHLPIATTSLRQYIHSHFVQVSARDAINFCWHTVFDDDPSPIGIIEIVVSDTQFIDETYLYIQTSFACALGEVFYKWLLAEDASRTEQKYWILPRMYLDTDFQPGPLERFMVKQWGRNLPSLLGVKLEQVLWIRKCLRCKGNCYSTEEDENFLNSKPECLKHKAVSRHLKNCGLKVKKMKKIIAGVDEKRLTQEDKSCRVCHVFNIVKKRESETNRIRSKNILSKNCLYKNVQDSATNTTGEYKFKSLVIHDPISRETGENKEFNDKKSTNTDRYAQKSVSVDGSICLDKVPLKQYTFQTRSSASLFRNKKVLQHSISDSSIVKLVFSDSLTDTIAPDTTSTDEKTNRRFSNKCDTKYTRINLSNDKNEVIRAFDSNCRITKIPTSGGIKLKVQKFTSTEDSDFNAQKYGNVLIQKLKDYDLQQYTSTEDSTECTNNSNWVNFKSEFCHSPIQKYTSTDDSTMFSNNTYVGTKFKVQKHHMIAKVKNQKYIKNHDSVNNSKTQTISANIDENKVQKCTITDDNYKSKVQKCTITDDNCKSKAQKCTNTDSSPSNFVLDKLNNNCVERQSKSTNTTLAALLTFSKRISKDSLNVSRSTNTTNSAHKSTSTVIATPISQSTNTLNVVHMSTSTVCTDSVDRSTNTIVSAVDNCTNTNDKQKNFPIVLHEFTSDDSRLLVNFPRMDYNCTIKRCTRQDCPIRIHSVYLENSTNTETVVNDSWTETPINVFAADCSTNTDIKLANHKSTETKMENLIDVDLPTEINCLETKMESLTFVDLPAEINCFETKANEFLSRLDSSSADKYIKALDVWTEENMGNVENEINNSATDTELFNRRLTNTETIDVPSVTSSIASLDMLLTANDVFNNGSKQKVPPTRIKKPANLKLAENKFAIATRAKLILPLKSSGRSSFPDKSSGSSSSTIGKKKTSKSYSRETFIGKPKCDLNLHRCETKTNSVSTGTGITPVEKFKATSATLTSLERANNIYTDFRPTDKPIKLNQKLCPPTKLSGNNSDFSSNDKLQKMNSKFSSNDKLQKMNSDCTFIDISSEISPDDLRAIEKLQSIITKLNDINKSDLLSNDGFPSAGVTDTVWPPSDDDRSKRFEISTGKLSHKPLKSNFENAQKIVKAPDLNSSRIPKSITKLPNVSTKPTFTHFKPHSQSVSKCSHQRRTDKLEKIVAKNGKSEGRCKIYDTTSNGRRLTGGENVKRPEEEEKNKTNERQSTVCNETDNIKCQQCAGQDCKNPRYYCGIVCQVKHWLKMYDNSYKSEMILKK